MSRLPPFVAMSVAVVIGVVLLGPSTPLAAQEPESDGSTEFTKDDPPDDKVQTWPDVAGIEGQNDAGDVEKMMGWVSPEGELTRLTLTYFGPTEEFPPGESLGGDILITRPSEDRILNFILRADGSIKGSDLPPGMGVLASWVTPEEYEILFSGLGVEPGTEVSLRTIQEYRGDFSSDEVLLILDFESAVATPDGTDSSGRLIILIVGGTVFVFVAGVGLVRRNFWWWLGSRDYPDGVSYPATLSGSRPNKGLGGGTGSPPRIARPPKFVARPPKRGRR